jgi:hypothetical protein
MKDSLDKTQQFLASARPNVAVVVEFLEQLVELLEQKGVLTRQELQRRLMRRYAAEDSVNKAGPTDPTSPEASSAQPHQAFRVRSAPRFSLNCRILFCSGQFEGKGTVCDLSKNGCRISSEILVERGMELALSLLLPDQPWPLRVDCAVVRWTRGKEFGLEFLRVSDAHEERLRLFLSSLAPQRGH